MKITLEQMQHENMKIDYHWNYADNSIIIIDFKSILSPKQSKEKIDELITKLDDIQKSFLIFISLKFNTIELCYDYSKIDNNFKFNLLSHLFIGRMAFKLKQENNMNYTETIKRIQPLLDAIKNFIGIKQLSKEDLYDLIVNRSQYNDQISKRKDAKINVFQRDHLLAELLKEYYNFRCIICNSNVERDDDNPYVESHHIKSVSRSGLDVASNIAIVCPNCHKTFHFGKSSQREKLIEIFKAKNPFINKSCG